MEFIYKMLSVKSGRVIAVVTGILLTASSALAEITVTGGPIIEPNKSEIILQNGENFTLVCKSNNIIEFKQQEQAEDMTLPFQINERTSRDDEYDYIIELDLLNVNEHAVGYFACFDDTINSDEVLKLNSLKAEPSNDEHITYIYVYVNGSENLFAPMNQVLTAKDDSIVVIGCRPTSPDIIVDLTPQTNKQQIKKGKTQFLPKVGYVVKSNIKSSYKCHGQRGNDTISKKITIHIGHNGTPIIVENRHRYFLAGEAFTISCYVKYEKNVAIHLDWIYPQMNEYPSRVIFETNEKDQFFEKIYKNITIINATEKDSGIYSCKVNNNPNRKAEAFMQYIEKPFINFTTVNKRFIEESSLKDTIKLLFTLISHPPANITLYKNNARVIFNDKYEWENKQMMNFYFLRINSLSLEDTANYTVVANNGQLSENVTFDIRIKSKPDVSMDLTEQTYVVHSNENNWIICEVSGYSLPEVDWYLTSYAYGTQATETLESIQEVNSLIRLKSYLDLNHLKYSGNVTCAAKNDVGSNNRSKSIILYEVNNGFGIKNKLNNWFVEGEDVILTCVGSFHVYYNVTWINLDNSSMQVEYYDNDISNVALLKLKDISMNQAGQYECKGYGKDGETSDYIEITVHETSPAIFHEPSTEMEENVYPHQNVTLFCRASGIPRPLISWLKDGDIVIPDDTNGTIIISQKEINKTDIESKLGIVNIQEDFGGIYECIADNAIRSKTFNINLNTTNTNGLAYLSIIAIIILILIFVIIYLIWRVRKEKMFRKELAKAGLLYFKEGVTKSINPDLGIDEQAELLPYDDRFEFPSSKLLLGKQLGSGAFGVVYKAEARGIINAEEDTIVAVKMVKKTADNLAIKSLASELKIMVHMGKHINIVNLLGACTKNVDKRELIVIVEYCKFGNILNYMIKHREVFIDQLTENTDQNFGKINRGFSCSSGNSGTHSTYFGSSHTQDTDHTFLNTVGSNRSGLRKDNGIQQVELGKVSESGYVQPMWSSNYESDYSYDGRTMRPLSSRDLLCWAFQIARGMEYLASRKVLHGDLAARNILLAEDNVVKICDFGLARSVYKNDEYQKKENSPLPVKWLAIECMTDRIFSTQSDVWSFGIVLWELFTLAKTPYPGISPSDLLPWLLAGKRLDKPRYADDRIYELMKQCWDKKPTARPSFTALQEILGSFLEDNVRTHYVDLNNTYLNLNQETAGQEDYLAMMRAPDYNNHVTPSPHDYVNEFNNFFPKTPTLLHDEEGYLQMNSINKGGYQPNIQESAFDFDSRKSTRSQEAAAHGTELTPMLTLNNLPTRSGSESDHEGNASPYLQTCPPIEEEADEVFEVKQNNIKNSNQDRAVTNPTYIAFDTDLEKKPQSHNYANIGNGLVI